MVFYYDLPLQKQFLAHKFVLISNMRGKFGSMAQWNIPFCHILILILPEARSLMFGLLYDGIVQLDMLCK